MKILGIETSCDETACAIVENGTRILSNVLFSQIDLHAATGGVVPEVAAREHVVKMIPALEKALKNQDFDAIAVTKGPGLISSLIIGTTTASTISLVRNKPIIPVNHIHGHIYANWLERSDDLPQFPALILTVSGGHNELILMHGHGNFEIIGETMDDAAGEAFDKVARLLGLDYPGGPAISKAALNGNREEYNLPRSRIDGFNFSFSGLKTAVLNLVKARNRLDAKFVADLAASFQEAICDSLSSKVVKALEAYNVKEVHLAGGVSANKRLREVMGECICDGVLFRYPKKIEFCTDNAAMIASCGYFMASGRDFEVGNIVADPNF